jgi:hypothetical protein
VIRRLFHPREWGSPWRRELVGYALVGGALVIAAAKVQEARNIARSAIRLAYDLLPPEPEEPASDA